MRETLNVCRSVSWDLIHLLDTIVALANPKHLKLTDDVLDKLTPPPPSDNNYSR